MSSTTAIAPAETRYPAPLGVGVLFNPSVTSVLMQSPDLCDYVEIMPDMFWTDRGAASHPRWTEIDSWIATLDRIAHRFPLVGHNIGLSLGTAGWSDRPYLDQLTSWYDRHPARWHSDHLAFVAVHGGPDHTDHATGIAAPVPYDRELLDLIVPRVQEVMDAIDRPFLVENNVCFTRWPDEEFTEPQFLNLLAARTGCGLLLDVHNLYVNARNHRFDPYAFLEEVDLSRVVEIHIAGGAELGDMYTDAHSGPCPPEVWSLLDSLMPRLSHVSGITFEFHESYFEVLGADGLRAELVRARQAWESVTHVAR